jgi:hypothetical protein
MEVFSVTSRLPRRKASARNDANSSDIENDVDFQATFGFSDLQVMIGYGFNFFGLILDKRTVG